jgi:enterobacterial common antigen flippase
MSHPRTAGADAERTDAGAASDGFRGILRSSALIGASSLINVCLGALRMKAMALLLGPAGIGLLGAFTVLLELTRNIAQLGLNGSGVRQIAEAASSAEQRRLAVTARVLRLCFLACALAGAVALALCAPSVAALTFGSQAQAGSVALLSLALFFAVLATGQLSLLQGTRRIAEQAKVSVYSALAGTVAAVCIVYFVGERGIVASLVVASAMSLLWSWSYSRDVRTADVALLPGEARREAVQLFRLGLAFLASGLFMLGAGYAVRTLVLRTLGLDAAGLYQAAWTLGGLYIGFILQALGTDFYPRLVGVVDDPKACNAMVNEQAQASLLLAAPGILATIVFAPIVLNVFYSAEFSGAVDLLRWMCVGMALRIITWPVGTIIVAKNRQLIFVAVEAAWAGFNVAATWWCLRAFGLEGAGIAFALSYVFHGLIVYPTAHKMTGFKWSADTLRLAAWFVLAIAAAFATPRALPHWPALALGTLLTVAAAWYCGLTLIRLSAAQDKLASLRRRLGLAGGAAP